MDCCWPVTPGGATHPIPRTSTAWSAKADPDSEGQWHTPKRAAFVWPAKALMPLFRGKLRVKILQLLQAGQLRSPSQMSAQRLRNVLNTLGHSPWHVHIGQRYTHGQGVATY
ncbi:MAG: hypothetical protein GKR94_30230 [Gammaproteobacteria bacterium]|nr:hypothetical protein [Gammaproteobacteria bacterium]